MTDHQRVLREMRDEQDTLLGRTEAPAVHEQAERRYNALTAALTALDGTRLKQDAERMETQRAQYAHLALKHDATEKRLTAALEDWARLRERIEALKKEAKARAKDYRNIRPALAHAEADAYDAVLDAIDAGEPPTQPTTLECQHMDPASGLTQPCFTAPLKTAHHWCEPCLRYARVMLSRLLPTEAIPQRDAVRAFAATLPMMHDYQGKHRCKWCGDTGARWTDYCAVVLADKWLSRSLAGGAE